MKLDILRYLADGGIISMRVYGKRIKTIDVVTQDRSISAGIKAIGELESDGLVRYGDPSPFRDGRTIPIVITDAGHAVLDRESQP